jgi:prefoldin subunit 5
MLINSGTFIFRNYEQALSIIHDEGIKLDHLARELNTGPADYEEYLESERQYLQDLKTEPHETVETVTYMEALVKLQAVG